MRDSARHFFANCWRRVTSSPDDPSTANTPAAPGAWGSTSRAGLSVAGAMATDVGRVRQSNEDKVLYVAPEAGALEAGFFALVADGMGGHAAGEVASEMAAELVRDFVCSSREAAPQALSNAFHAANRAIFERGRNNPDLQGMGTTCTAIVIRGDRLFLAHIGDSRAYLWRQNELRLLSDDQTLHAKLIRDGLMTPEEAKVSPGANFILQALGARETIEPTIMQQGLPLQAGDILLLCSDGLYSFVEDPEIARTIAAHAPQEACERLIEAANAAGGADNISVGIFRIVDALPLERNEQASTKPIVLTEPDSESSNLSK